MGQQNAGQQGMAPGTIKHRKRGQQSLEFYDFEEYRRELSRDYGEGLLTEDEYAEALCRINAPRQKEKREITVVEAAEEDIEKVQRLEDFYHRELFGRVSSEEDHKLVTLPLLGFVNERVGGALWYASEPTPDYKGCLYLDMLYVLEEFRGSRLGSRLLAGMLEQVKEEHCIITYAWKPSEEFYRVHGFLPTEQEAEKEGEHFRKFVLPLDSFSLERYCREAAADPFELYEELVDSSFPPDFMEKFREAVENGSNFKVPGENPLTAFLYRKAGRIHIAKDINNYTK